MQNIQYFKFFTMKQKKVPLELFFNNIEEGQQLFHHKTDWWAFGSKIIAWFGKFGSAKMPKKSHTSTIVDVVRTSSTLGNDVIFSLFESTFANGVGIHPRTRRITQRIKLTIDKDGKIKGLPSGKYEIHGFAKNEYLYWCQGKPLIGQEKEKFRNTVKILCNGNIPYAHIKNLKKTYFEKSLKFISRFFGINIDGINLQIKTLEEKKKEGFYCSELNHRLQYESGVITKDEYDNNPYPDPMELAKILIKRKNKIIRIK